MQKILDILKQDKNRIKILNIVYELELPHCYIAAGFIRNLIWDHTHGYNPTKLNDIDVIYYDDNEADFTKCLSIESQLNKNFPEYNWEVRNQALMHIRNNDKKYNSTIDAMSYWPEKETAVGIKKINIDEYEIISVFDLNMLFRNTITHNPKRDIKIFNNRIKDKDWLRKWPKLKKIY